MEAHLELQVVGDGIRLPVAFEFVPEVRPPPRFIENLPSQLVGFQVRGIEQDGLVQGRQGCLGIVHLDQAFRQRDEALHPA